MRPVDRDHSTAEFFDATSRGAFPLRRCTAGGHYSRPQAHQCSVCGDTELDWADASGGARLISWAVLPPRSEATEPKVVIVVEFDEGPWWWSQLVGVGPDEIASLAEGRRLRVVFERPEAGDEAGAAAGEAVPVFALER